MLRISMMYSISLEIVFVKIVWNKSYILKVIQAEL